MGGVATLRHHVWVRGVFGFGVPVWVVLQGLDALGGAPLSAEGLALGFAIQALAGGGAFGLLLHLLEKREARRCNGT